MKTIGKILIVIGILMMLYAFYLVAPEGIGPFYNYAMPVEVDETKYSHLTNLEETNIPSNTIEFSTGDPRMTSYIGYYCAPRFINMDGKDFTTRELQRESCLEMYEDWYDDFPMTIEIGTQSVTYETPEDFPWEDVRAFDHGLNVERAWFVKYGEI